MTNTLFRDLYDCLLEPLNGSSLRTIFLLLTRAHYSDSKNYGYLKDDLACLKYSDDMGECSLFVELGQEYDYNKATRRPAVYVNFPEPMTFRKVDLTQKQDNFEDNSGYTSGVIAETVVSFAHVHNSMDTALLLADSTTSFFFAIRSTIMSHLNLMQFDPIIISNAKVIEKAPERFFRVDVNFKIMFNYKVDTNLESHRLKKFALELEGT
jgi:hypothetical protein